MMVICTLPGEKNAWHLEDQDTHHSVQKERTEGKERDRHGQNRLENPGAKGHVMHDLDASISSPYTLECHE
jgi:hypothetical protein